MTTNGTTTQFYLKLFHISISNALFGFFFSSTMWKSKSNSATDRISWVFSFGLSGYSMFPLKINYNGHAHPNFNKLVYLKSYLLLTVNSSSSWFITR
uniref:Uncharacterized protein n=1 Tax=Arundo donax TaxID=35708 RepID=A0A0A9DXG5_ARUDO